MHLFFYFRLLAFLLLNVANKIIDGNPFKAKLGIFIEEQGATSVESLWKGATDHEGLRTTGLYLPFNIFTQHNPDNSQSIWLDKSFTKVMNFFLFGNH